MPVALTENPRRKRWTRAECALLSPTGVWAVALLAPFLLAQAPSKKPFQAQSSSTVKYDVKDRAETVELTNVTYELSGRLLLRKTTRSKQVLDEKGMDASTTIEAWPVGVALTQKPLYTVTAQGMDPIVVNNELLVISRGLEETAWWSVYKLGTGVRLFDTYVPLAQVSIARDTVKLRYVGLEVPEGDAASKLVANVIYASGDKVLRRAEITGDDPKRAQLLRSFADSTRTVTLSPRSIQVSISQNYPSAPATINITIPLVQELPRAFMWWLLEWAGNYE
jgi:hypothetical protein